MSYRKYWLAFSRLECRYSRALIGLFDHFGSMERVCQASGKELAELPFLSEAARRSILEALEAFDLKEAEAFLERSPYRLIVYQDEDYPLMLRHIPSPPLVLFCDGEMIPEDRLALSIVGSRNATPYGRSVALGLAKELASLGITIVSGMARGVDSWAHKGAIDGGGRTIAVLGSGIDITYPAENRGLRNMITRHGAVLSEYPPGTGARKHQFPERNRIIAGLTLGTLVIEAGLKSGSLITAASAMESGREVFAVPGSILGEQNRGSHRLLKDGAKLVETVEDILDEFGFSTGSQGHPAPDLEPLEKQILSVLAGEGQTPDFVSKTLRMETQDLMARLSMMEIKGLLERGSGSRYFPVIKGKNS